MTFSNPGGGAKESAPAYTRALLDLLGDRDPIGLMAGTPAALGEATGDLSPEELRRPEAEGKWSVVQVAQHLADSELIYGYRLRLVVAEDDVALPGYDQDLWADRLRYASAKLPDALRLFGELRRANLAWLATLSEEELARAGEHDERGRESVSRIVQLLAAHDVVHLRQIERIRRAIGRD